MTSDPTINQLHAIYVEMTGIVVRLDYERERHWHEWNKAGLTVDDLRLLIKETQRRIRDNEGCNAYSLTIRNLVGNVSRAEENLAIIRARMRKRPVDPARAAILRTTGRAAVSPPPDARSAAQIIEGEKAFEQFRKLKGEL